LVAGAEKNGFLDRLNRLLESDLSANQFVTFVVVFLDPVTSMLKVHSAGHGPILWYRRAPERIESIAAQGIPLGIIAGVSYEQGTELQLERGDILVLITDGFYEWENPDGEEFGLVRLEAVIKESRNLSADQIIEALRSAVMSFCRGTRQMDDLTAVVLKRRTTTAE
jgi:serine phosphatase RsbU (regulator of sigma subunit)